MDNKKNLLAAFFLVALVGCDQGSEKKDISAVQDSSASNATSTTALYLPGDVGIDFGVTPVKDEIVDYKGDGVRVVIYYLESEAGDIDSELSTILQAEGYKRVEHPKETNDLSVSYINSSGRVLFRYKKQVSEGFKKYTRLVVSWRI